MATEQSTEEEGEILPGVGTDVDKLPLSKGDRKTERIEQKLMDTSPESTNEVANTGQLNKKGSTSDQSTHREGRQVANNTSQAHEQTTKGEENPQTRQATQQMTGSLHAGNTNTLGCESTTVSPLQTTEPIDPTYSAVPLCLPTNRKWNPNTRKIEFDEAVDRNVRGHVKICNEGRKLLESIGDDLVIVVCVTGPARTGKSFLLSQFHDDVNFELGHSMMSHTTGIWAALSPEVIKVGQETARLLLLDAEGLDAVCTSDHGGSDDWDRKLFSVCTLLSSYMIYNCQLTPRATDLDKLGVIAQFSKAIYYNTQKESMEQVAKEFRRFAPHFLWLIRDARLPPTIDGHEFTWDEYMEKFVLTYKENDDNRNAVRKAIKSVFQSVHAYALPTPCSHEDDFANLSSLNNKVTIKPLFLRGVQDIRNRILDDPKIKRNLGLDVNGKSLNSLLTMYVSAVNNETDKLEIKTISEAVVQSQLNSGISNAIKVYEEMMAAISLPAENEELIYVHQSAEFKAHAAFEKSAQRIHDHNRPSSSKRELSERITHLFERLKERNNKESENCCLKEMENLKHELVNCLKENFQNYGCNEIKLEKQNLLERYRENSKGPMVSSVEADSKSHIEAIISKYRNLSLQEAEGKAEVIYKETAKLTGIPPFEASEIDDCHEKALTHSLQSLSRAYDKCDDCEQRKDSFCNKLRVSLDEWFQSNHSESLSYCEKVAEEAKLNHFEKAKETILSRDFSFFQKAKAKVLQVYNQNARGPAKENVKKKCETDLENKLKVIENIVIKAALKDANELYKLKLRKIIEVGPCDDEELRDNKKMAAEAVLTPFSKRCEGISETKYGENEERLKCNMESQDATLLCENKLKSSALCDELCERLFKECNSKILELVSMVVSKSLTEPFDFNSELKKLKQSLLEQYLAISKGPMKRNGQERFKELIDLKFGETQRSVATDALGKAIEKFNELVENLLKSGAFDENDLEAQLMVAARKTETLFDDRVKSFEELYVKPVKRNLEKVINILKANCIHRNAGMTFQHCEAVMADVTRKHKDEWKASLLSLDLDNVASLNKMFDSRKKKSLEEYKNKVKGPSAHYFYRKCTDEIDRQIKELRVLTSNSNLNNLILHFRETVQVRVVGRMPFDDPELQSRKSNVYQDLLSAFNKRFTCTDEGNLKDKEKMLKEAANDILSKLDAINNQKSRKYCEEMLQTVLMTMQDDCAALCRDCLERSLEIPFHPMTRLQEIKVNCLNTFDENAKGPAQESVREKCCDDIDKHFVNVKRKIITDALKRSTDMYSTKFELIRDEDFLDDTQLGVLKTQFSNTVKQHFNERCGYFDRGIMEEYQELLEKSVYEIDVNIDKRHTDLSREQCQNLSDGIIGRVQQSCHQLALQVKRQNIDYATDIFASIDSIRVDHLAEYNQKAKGSEKNKVEETFRIKLEKELHDVQTSISKYFLSKCLDAFKSQMDIVLSEGPQDETYLNGRCTEFTLSTIMLFQTKCEGLEESSYSSDVETLRYYLEEAKKYFKRKNEYSSFAFCSDLLKDMQHTRKKYKRKSNYLAEYRKKAKGPMIEEALSNFMDPIETHYKSWYGLFSRLNPF